MEQVKRDMEADEKLKKDLESVRRSTQRLREQGRRQEEHLRSFGDNVQSFSSNASARFVSFKERAVGSAGAASSRLSETVEHSAFLRSAREYMRTGLSTGAAGSQAALNRTKQFLGGGVDRASAALSYFGDEHKKAEKLRQWKAARDAAAAAEALRSEQTRAAEEAAAAGEQAAAQPPPGPEGALVVSKAGNSSWDRFGAGLRDMPFLSSVFDNPLFDQLFGESEIAASIREMKEIDSRFQLEDFAEDIEYIVAPHIISNYLVGDHEALMKHCGDAAFAAVNASIKARKQQKLTLDAKILAGPNELELKGAKLMEKGAPCFIWTFNTQQVNCLRDSSGEIIEGAVDDIRTVHYAMAITRHPDLDQLDLEYPWQVSELAILGNQPCW